MLYRKEIHANSHREGDIINITDAIGTAIQESGIKDGVAHLFVDNIRTAALTTIEYEPGRTFPRFSGEHSPFSPRIVQIMLIMPAGVTGTASSHVKGSTGRARHRHHTPEGRRR